MTQRSVATTTRLPESIEELSADWFSFALGKRFPGVAVSGVDAEHIHWGTATKALLRLSYDDAPDGAPSRVCLKGGFDPAMRAYLAGAYQREVEFFGLIAPDLDLPLPQTFYAEGNVEQGQAIVVMENLVAGGATFGECTEPWSADQVSAGLAILARLHAQTWGSDTRYPWLTTETPVRAVSEVLFSADHWHQLFSAGTGPDVPDELLDRERMQSALKALWRIDDNSTGCVVHGDAHLGNTYSDTTGRPAFLDWQCVHTTPHMLDVAYFTGGALTVDDRRANERDLVSHYLEHLAAAGGPRLGIDQAWPDYVQQTLYGYVWALTSPDMQPPERIAAMTERHLTAIQDHGSVQAVLDDPRAKQ